MYRFEIEINSDHVLIFLTILTVIYTVYVLFYIIRDERRMKGKGRRKRKYSYQSEIDDDDIMGKSKFVLEESVPPPQVTATAESAPQYPRQVAPEELDNVFGAPPQGEANHPLDIYQPLYAEQALSKGKAYGGYYDSDDDECEYLPLRGRQPARGVKFEELGDAYNRVVYNPIMTEKEEVTTGRILLDLKPTDMFEYIVSGDQKRENTAHYLIDVYLDAFRKRMLAEEAESLPMQDVIAPQGYTVSDSVRPIRRPR